MTSGATKTPIRAVLTMAGTLMTHGAQHLRAAAGRGSALAGLLILLAIPAMGQSGDRSDATPINSIEVLVNDEPITSFDINRRLRLVIAVSGGVSSEEEFMQLREQVIKALVDEKLQIQEAAENDLTVQDEELERFFARRAEGTGQSPEQFERALEQIGAGRETMVNQMRAELVWSRLVQGRMGAFVSVSDEEVNAFIQRIYDNKGKFEYRLSEIVLLTESSAQNEAIKANAEEIVERIRDGAPFPQLAQQLSASPTAAVGGDLGWVTSDDLSAAQEKAVNTINIGDVADPIRTPGGYVIIAVRDRRRILTADPLDKQLDLRQLHLKADTPDLEDAETRFRNTIENMPPEGERCGQLESVAEKAGANGRLDLGQLRLRDLQGSIRKAVQDLEDGQATDIIALDDGLHVLVVCGTTEPEIREPEYDQIYNQLEQQRLSMMGRRYLRDLRRDAIIDYR
ncbi:peptidylprolyl isomerase [Yunchengibacter salinarum]|uniref:peptidylprolyl isomerase n=1 Tax=Yunchengibacter salinarum TaxID=3133399 RepID=UPI0035B61CB9